MNSIDELILEYADMLEVVIENIQGMDKDEYAIARKDGFGASDSSVLLGVNLYKDIPALIKEKNNKFLTEEEKAVGEKPIVKKGYDLEDIILQKAEQILEVNLFKPRNMYGFKEMPGLNVNYDGVYVVGKQLIPVEAKLVSKWGEKYYDKSPNKMNTNKTIDMKIRDRDVIGHIKAISKEFGIPPYYYTQVQQEIAGLGSQYGYLVAQFDESWETHVYYIKRDEYVIAKIYAMAEKYLPQIKKNS